MSRTVLVLVGAVLIAAAFAAGRLPERQQRTAAEAGRAALQDQLTAAEAKLRAAALLGQVIAAREVATRQNYGQALTLSSAFFDAVRGEAAATPDPTLREALHDVLGRRDAVTAGLARNEATAVEVLHDLERRLRQALGYSVPPASPTGV